MAMIRIEPRQQLVAVILTYNEESNLPACLESLRGLGCQVFVVDSGSTDRTVAIARAGGAHVVQHPFEHYAAQRNWAQANLPVHSEWVLHLDADERLTAEVVAEINRRFEQVPINADGFMLRKRTIFMGRWIRRGGHYPSYHLRLFRTGKGRCEDRLYDQHFVVEGHVERLTHDYIDVVTTDVHNWTLRHLRWAKLEAFEVERRPTAGVQVRQNPLGNPIERRRWLRERVYRRGPLFFRAFLYFLYRYVLRLGFLDGKQGFLFHFLQGFWFRVLVDAYIDELRRNQSLRAGATVTEGRRDGAEGVRAAGRHFAQAQAVAGFSEVRRDASCGTASRAKGSQARSNRTNHR